MISARQGPKEAQHKRPDNSSVSGRWEPREGVLVIRYHSVGSIDALSGWAALRATRLLPCDMVHDLFVHHPR